MRPHSRAPCLEDWPRCHAGEITYPKAENGDDTDATADDLVRYGSYCYLEAAQAVFRGKHTVDQSKSPSAQGGVDGIDCDLRRRVGLGVPLHFERQRTRKGT